LPEEIPITLVTAAHTTLLIAPQTNIRLKLDFCFNANKGLHGAFETAARI
jgi:hypothetical protein